ncbi:MAG: 50S ribosomal protein L18 [Chloroflexi bacterium]|nr:50S ribosomal protein L18 [Chloroflexota bacterium]
MPVETRRAGRVRRHARVRERITGTAERPRLSVHRSLTHMYAQVIDDATGRTLASASDLDVKTGRSPAAQKNKTERAKAVGKLLADKAKAAGISDVIFDRGGYRYHGRIKALADAAREAGLKF